MAASRFGAAAVTSAAALTTFVVRAMSGMLRSVTTEQRMADPVVGEDRVAACQHGQAGNDAERQEQAAPQSEASPRRKYRLHRQTPGTLFASSARTIAAGGA